MEAVICLLRVSKCSLMWICSERAAPISDETEKRCKHELRSACESQESLALGQIETHTLQEGANNE